MSFVLCEICLTPADPSRLKPRDLSLFYALNPAAFHVQDPHAWLCAYCWTRICQFVHFIETAKHSRIFLTAVSSQPDMLASLKPTDLHLYAVRKLPDLVIENAAAGTASLRIQSKQEVKTGSHSKSALNRNVAFEPVNVKEECEDSSRSGNMKEELDYLSAGEKVEISVSLKQESAERERIDLSPLRETSNEASSSAESEKASTSAPAADSKFDQIEMSEEEMLKSREQARELRAFTTRKYRCQTCILGFETMNSYRLHFKNFHAEEHPYECPICRCRYPLQCLIQTHKLEHYMQFKCRECEFMHKSRNVMNTHYEVNHRIDVYPCKRCDQSFLTRRLRKLHTSKEHDTEQKDCQECGKTFSNRYSYRNHVMKIHNDASIRECHICNKKIRGDMKQHLHTHNPVPDPNAYCPECDKQFRSEYSYRHHLKTTRKHAAQHELTQYECAECRLNFSTKSGHRYHIIKIHQKRTSDCPHCERKFTTGYALRQHIRKVHDNVPDVKDHVCDVCDRAFTCKANLRNHMRTHTGERPFQCQTCGDRFSFRAALYTHNRLVHLKLKRGKKKSTV